VSETKKIPTSKRKYTTNRKKSPKNTQLGCKKRNQIIIKPAILKISDHLEAQK
jgi:hypothetical protein